MNPIMSHTKCQKCQKIFNAAELNESSDGIGYICIDDVACRKRLDEKKLISNPTFNPTR